MDNIKFSKEQAVEYLEKCLKYIDKNGVVSFMKNRSDVLEMSIEALKEQTKKEKNKPLTFEELLAKENKPVWVEHCHGGEWVVVCWDYVDRIAYSRNACLHQHNYGKDWIAYNYEITEEERWKRWK